MSLQQRTLRSALGRQPNQLPRDTRVAIIRLLDGIDVRGTIHVPPGIRILDLLNREVERFIAVTNATISAVGQETTTPFIALNKAHIISLYEQPEGEGE